MPDEPKPESEPQAGSGAGAQAAKTGATAGGDPQAGESISLEKAKELRAENKSLRDRMKALEDEKTKRDEDERKAKDAKAKEEGRLADVLTERESEIATLKPRADLATKLEKLFSDQFEAASKDWPDEIKAMVPEGLEARIDAMPKLEALVAKLSPAPPGPGNGRGPKPAGAPTPAESAATAVDRVRRQRVYGL